MKASKISVAKRYLDLYLSFLKLEIPNILQIVGFISFFGLISNSTIIKWFSPAFVAILLNFYLMEKYLVYVRENSSDNESFKTLLRGTKRYVIITIIVIGFLQLALYLSIRNL